MHLKNLLGRGKWRKTSALLIGLPLLAFASPAWGACSASSASADLGEVSSLAVATTPQGAITATGFSCTGSGELALLTTNEVTATIQSATNSNGTQPRLYNAVTQDYIPYTICKDASCTATYPIGTEVSWISTTFLGLLNLFSGPGGTLPLYIRTASGTQVAAGTYTSTITVNWTWDVCTIGALVLCLTRDRGAATRTIGVTMVVSKDCAISAPPVDFGSAALVASFDAVTQSISVRCSKNAAYTVGIDDGLYALDNVRRLSNGTGFIDYDIVFPAGSSSRWGKSPLERRSSAQATVNSGSLTGNTAQGFTYSAIIDPSQPTPTGGTYTDTLTVDVEF